MYHHFSFRVLGPVPAHSLLALTKKFERAGHTGWLRHGPLVEGRVICLHRDVRLMKDNLRSALPDVSIDLQRTSKTSDVAGFHLVWPERVAAWWRSGALFIDAVDHRGVVKGWAWHPNGRPSLAAFVDGSHVAAGEPRIFRADLLEAGLPDGDFGFEVALPDTILDGQEHTLTIVGAAPSGKMESRPFRFQAPKPCPPAPARIAARLTGMVAVRARLVQQGLTEEIRSEILQEWDRQPDSVFVDVGLVEAHRRRGSPFLSFRERLAHRLASQKCPPLVLDFNRKTFTKEYAERHGIATPRTLLVTDRFESIAGFDFPRRFVIKPVGGSGLCTFLYSDGLFSGRDITVTGILDEVRKHMAAHAGAAFVIEELLSQRGAGFDHVPLDYKLHTFGGRVRIVHVDDRNVPRSRDGLRRQQGWFAADWTPAPFSFRSDQEEAFDFEPPDTLPEMIRIAEMIGSDCGDYVRVDLYDTPTGVVLGEVTIFSHGGVGFSEIGDRILAQTWHVSAVGNPHLTDWTTAL